jgi:ribosomal protein S7
MGGLAARYPEAERALVQYALHWEPGKHNLEALRDRLHKLFPRWYTAEVREIGAGEASPTAFTPDRMKDVAGTVAEYLAGQLAKHPQRAEMLRLAEELLAEEDLR